MKKIELHLHLEGAAPPALVRSIAAEQRIDLSGLFDDRGHYAYHGFDGFLRCYEAATSVFRTPRDYARLLAEVLERSAAEGVTYTELFVSPEFCGGADLPVWRDHLAAMAEVAEAARANGIDSRAILTAIRHFGPDRARKTAICAAETAGGWVAGFGMGGAETEGRATDFAWAFDCAREAGLGLTCHAGEWGGPDSIRDALSLGVSRIGHGVRAIEDVGALVRDLVEAGITLEVCPGSNVALGIYPSWPSHPVARLADAGVRVTLSTDDPPFFHTTMRREYDRLADVFGWGDTEFTQINRWAAEAAFCDPATRDRLCKEFPVSQHLTVIDHPLVQHKLTIMRRKDVSTAGFRRLLREISLLLAYEVTRELELTTTRIETPLCPMDAPTLDGKKLALISILRAGNGLLDGILEMIPSARVGFVGMYRDPDTLRPVEYYCKVPRELDARLTIVVDPMLATGNSAVAAVDLLKARGATNLRFLCLLAAPEGVARMREAHPDVPVFTAALDERLNDHGYIVPGLGDAGDRMFGTK